MDKKENKPLYISFSTQKGGAGKTTLTVLIASYLHYVKNLNVAVIDCDFPQYSIKDMRERDMKKAESDSYYKVQLFELLGRLHKKCYTVLCSRLENAASTAERLWKTEEDLDIVFFDFPGTINNPKVVETLAMMDYIFTPIIADRVVMESSISFATIINDEIISKGKGSIKGIHLIWNMVDGREKTELYEVYEKICSNFGLHILDTHLPDSKRFRKEMTEEKRTVFRSTMFPMSKALVKGSNIDFLTEEILDTIQK
ncbi:MAG: ParA family protein [Prevotella sp.]|nr:ParA family protein [Prevotella sp.]